MWWHHVDQLVHGEPDGRMLEPRAALRLLHDADGRLPRLLGHSLPAEGAHPQRQGAAVVVSNSGHSLAGISPSLSIFQFFAVLS